MARKRKTQNWPPTQESMLEEQRHEQVRRERIVNALTSALRPYEIASLVNALAYPHGEGAQDAYESALAAEEAGMVLDEYPDFGEEDS